MHFAVDAEFVRLVEGRAEFFVPVHDGRDRMEHRGIEAQLLRPDVRDVELRREAVGTGNRREVMLEDFVPRPGGSVDFSESHVVSR